MAVILNLAMLHSAIIVFPLKLTHTCQDWFPLFAQRNLHSFIVTQLDDGSHPELCHDGLIHCHLGFRHLVIFSQIHSKHSHSILTLTQTNSIQLTRWWQPSWILASWIQPCCTKLWLQLIQSDSNSFILTELDDGSHHEFCNLGFSHLHTKKLYSCILTQIDDGSHLEFCHLRFSNFAQIILHLIILTQLDDGSHLEFCQLEFHYLGFSHFAQKNFTYSFLLNFIMAAILNSAILDSAILHK